MEKHSELAPLIQMTLRTYGGIFEHMTTISTYLLSKKSGRSEHEIKTALERLEKDGLIDLEIATSDLELNFLVPREDERTINRFARQIETQNKLKSKLLDAMLGYLKNTTRCRSQQLLSYFGEEHTAPCGSCDVCKKAPAKEERATIKKMICASLQREAMDSKKLKAVLGIETDILLSCLRELVQEGQLEINRQNAYEVRNI